MENDTSKNYRSLYLSPIDISKLAQLEMNFKITLLVANPKDGYNPVFIDEYKQSKEFRHLWRVGTIKEILRAVNRHNLVLNEFILERNDIRIQSVTNSNDILIETIDASKAVNDLLSAVTDSWMIPNIQYSINDIEVIKPNTLFQISSEDGTPQEEENISNKEELVKILLEKQTQQIADTGFYVTKPRIYYSTVKTMEQA